MNIERLTKLAEWLENGALHNDVKFDMSKGIAITSIREMKPGEYAAGGSRLGRHGAHQ